MDFPRNSCSRLIRKLMSVYVDIGFTLLNATIQRVCKDAT
nr:MAG TPA: hypothetical protein [Caudoviricetes sp.]